MYESLYQKIPSVEKYLKRIHIEKAEAPSLEFLNKLIYAHQLSIPFENIDSCLLKKRVFIDPVSLYDKIIMGERGGYCFELNGLFFELLTSLGFDAYPCKCKVVRGSSEGDHLMTFHRGAVVTLEGRKYLCDVGYGGPMAPGSVLIDPDEETVYQDEAFRIEEVDEPWLLLSRKKGDGSWEKQIEFYLMKQDKVDFVPLNHFAYTDSRSKFTQTLFINLRTPDGSVSITDDVFVKRDKSGETTEKIKNRKRLVKLLKTYFGIYEPLLEKERVFGD